MATTVITHPTKAGNPVNDTRYSSWLGMKSGDVGARSSHADYAERKCLHGILTGTAGILSLRGSNLPDPDVTIASQWFSMNTSPFGVGTNIAITTSGGISSEDNPLWVSPAVSGGDGTTSYDAYLVSKKVS